VYTDSPRDVTFTAVAIYLAFTFTVSEWRMGIRRQANELDSRANTRAIDSLLNYETVKYFNNEEYEARRYDENLKSYEQAAVKTEASLGLLNIGQSLIIAAAVTALMMLAAEGIASRSLRSGPGAGERTADQLYIPFLGAYRPGSSGAGVDMDRIFRSSTRIARSRTGRTRCRCPGAAR
jgi:ATP-binding cassette subfamily B protein